MEEVECVESLIGLFLWRGRESGVGFEIQGW